MVAAAPDAAIEIVMKRGDVGMRGARPFGALRVRKRKALDEAERIGIPAREIERFGQREMIEIERETHEIVGGETPRRIFAQNGDLHRVIGGDLFRGEAPKVEPCGGIGFCDGEMRQRDLVE